MADDVKKDVEELKASARGIHVSPRKARLVSNLVKNLPVADALTQLEFVGKKAALPIRKLINSAIANALHNHQIEADKLFVKNLFVDGGRVFFRYTPRAQGRAFPIRKRTSHINLILGVSKQSFPSRKKLVPLKKKDVVENKPQKESAPVVAGAEPKKSRFAFWRKKKEQDASQVPPKEDVKGKHYTGFDRRGNMGA